MPTQASWPAPTCRAPSSETLPSSSTWNPPPTGAASSSPSQMPHRRSCMWVLNCQPCRAATRMSSCTTQSPTRSSPTRRPGSVYPPWGIPGLALPSLWGTRRWCSTTTVTQTLRWCASRGPRTRWSWRPERGSLSGKLEELIRTSFWWVHSLCPSVIFRPMIAGKFTDLGVYETGETFSRGFCTESDWFVYDHIPKLLLSRNNITCDETGLLLPDVLENYSIMFWLSTQSHESSWLNDPHMIWLLKLVCSKP